MSKMSNLNIRLATSTALVTALVGFFNLPSEAVGSEIMGGMDKPKAASVPLAQIIDEKDIENATTSKNSNKSGLTADEKVVQGKKAGGRKLTVEETQAEKDKQLNTTFEPMMVNNNGNLEFTEQFHKLADVTLLANHYAYCLTKGNTRLGDIALTQLHKQGFKQIGLFSALEGKHLDFWDHSAGVVLYNTAENIYFVVWRGTASNEEGWQTNFNNQLIAGGKMKSHLIETIRNEIVFTLLDEKGLFFSGQHDAQLDEIMQYVKENLTTDLSIDEIIHFRDGLKKIVGEKLKELATKTPLTKEKVNLMTKIDAMFAAKLDLLGKNDHVVDEVKAATLTLLQNKIEELHNDKDEKSKAQNNQSISELKGLVKHVRENLSKMKTAEEIEDFMSGLKDKVDSELTEVKRKSLGAKLLRKQSPTDRLKMQLKYDIDSKLAEAERADKLKRLYNAVDLDVTGKVHAGYGLKVASAGKQIDDIIRSHASKLDKDLRQRARVLASGHSMAGALSKIWAASFKNSYKDIFGHEATAGNNRLMVHALSAAPTGDYTFKNSIEKSLGLGNIVDQKVAEDFVPKADPVAYTPQFLKKIARYLPWVGKELSSRMESDYAPQIGVPVIDKVEDVNKRIAKKFPGKAPTGLIGKKIATPHYGIHLHDEQPVGENYGREDHFEVDLAKPESKSEWNAMLANGKQKVTDAFTAKVAKQETAATEVNKSVPAA
jgi:hypothetical protein